MANSPDSSRAGRDGNRRSLRDLMDAGNGSGSAQRASAGQRPPSDPWGGDPPATDELETTSAEENERILAAFRRSQGEETAESPAAGEESFDDPVAVAEMTDENDRLRGIIGELRQLLDETTAKGGEAGNERELEYQSMLEDKGETIRGLHIRIQELEALINGEEAPAEAAADDKAPSAAEAMAQLSDEIERERCAIEQERRRLEDDRRQLREDEESMMRQMREMEMQMSKERAELARQRNELQRLHSEIRHELELAQRDAAVNERLRMLQRRSSADASSPEKPAAPKPARKSAQGTQKQPPKAPPPKTPPPKEGGGGLFRRLFGGDK
jgi:hypothetical protein